MQRLSLVDNVGWTILLLIDMWDLHFMSLEPSLRSLQSLIGVPNNSIMALKQPK